MDWLQQIDFWHWWVLALALVVLEILSPAAFFLWIGAAAAMVGLLLFLAPQLGWELQLVVFAVLSVAAVLSGRRLFPPGVADSDQPHLNRRGEQYVGRTFVIEDGIVDGGGKIRVDDSTWKVHGTDCPPGTRVRVNGVDGVVLRVELAD